MVSVRNIVDLARTTLQDTSTTSGTQRWTDDMLLRYLAVGVRNLVDQRPDALLTSTGTRNSVSNAYSVSDEIDVSISFLEPLAEYLCYMALLEDDADRGNAQSADFHLKRYNQLVKGA